MPADLVVTLVVLLLLGSNYGISKPLNRSTFALQGWRQRG